MQARKMFRIMRVAATTEKVNYDPCDSDANMPKSNYRKGIPCDLKVQSHAVAHSKDDCLRESPGESMHL